MCRIGAPSNWYRRCMRTLGMITAEKHQQGIEHYLGARFEEAARVLGEALEDAPTGELWNDWAAAQLACGRLADAERGFRQAVGLDSEHGQAAANLGAVLLKQGQFEPAIEFLEKALQGNHIGSDESAAAKRMLELCRKKRMAAEAARIEWWHSIDLGNGIVTPGQYDTRTLLDRIGMPSDLSGLSVLDIGAWDGYFSFEAERRGASRVVALDSYVWRNAIRSGKAGFLFARQALGSQVEDVEMEVMEIAPEKMGQFDVVLFLGVLYHLRHPLRALERVRRVTKKLLIMETHVDLPGLQRPAMAFYPGVELNNDATNWWGPNEACCIEMLKAAGFRNVKIAGRLLPVPVASIGEISYGRTAFHAE